MAAGENQVPAYLLALAGLYRQLGGLWLRGLERQRWREKVAAELELLAWHLAMPVSYTTVRPHSKDIEWGDGTVSCIRVEAVAVVPSDVALALLKVSRFNPRGCADRAAACAELSTMAMGLHYNPEASAYMECSPFCGSEAGAAAAWGAAAAVMMEAARECPALWGPARDAYCREVLMIMGGQSARGG